ncbi:hypothetical protein E6C27_scaffold175G001300 [Cucumis melo var. makuwa]|uniref:Uncharacterized protein n=1 Tax=Cucumis melo var. makuwa TaxID=1194695 RepID=A0A5A7UA82_CUCMM|nr:hypothetical protein E6C27_scaffold175G001300 [Cucumis melo var. makuwa]
MSEPRSVEAGKDGCIVKIDFSDEFHSFGEDKVEVKLLLKQSGKCVSYRKGSGFRALRFRKVEASYLLVKGACPRLFVDLEFYSRLCDFQSLVADRGRRWGTEVKQTSHLILGFATDLSTYLVVPKYDIGRQRVKALSDSNRIHGEELPFDELVKPRRSSEKSLGQKEGGWAISRPFAIAIRVARLYTAWLRYRS